MGNKLNKRRINIALISDFFIPSLGGVEMHMYNVAECLIEMGHKVIIITTHFSGERIGVRCLPNLLKVYHLPLNIMVNGTSFPDIFAVNMPIVRQIFLREQIEIVNNH